MSFGGDWKCWSCGFKNFSSRTTCKNCSKATKPMDNSSNNMEKKKGDWNCTGCGFGNFSSRTACKNCGKDNVNNGINNGGNILGNNNNMDQMKKGDWNCGGCRFNNFASRDTCKNCNMAKIQQPPSSIHNTQSNQMGDDKNKDGEWVCMGMNCGCVNARGSQRCIRCNLENEESILLERVMQMSKQYQTKNDYNNNIPQQSSINNNMGINNNNINSLNNNNVNNLNNNFNNGEVKKGDWSCGGCGFNNFASRDSCKNCSLAKSQQPSTHVNNNNNNNGNNNMGNNNMGNNDNNGNKGFNNGEIKKGDWNCGGCGFNNFASRDSCKNCSLEKSQQHSSSPNNMNENSTNSNGNNFNSNNFGNGNNFNSNNNNNVNNGFNNGEMKKGDWNCESCKFLNFASRDSCKNCGAFKIVGNNNNSNVNNNSNSNNTHFNNNNNVGNNNNEHNHSNLVYYEDLNNDNVSNYYIKEFNQKSKSKEIFSEQLVSSYHSLSSTKVFPKTSIAMERLYQTVKNESNCFNDCRKVAEACLEDIYFFLNNQHLSGMLFDKIDTFKNMIRRSNGPETATLNMVATYVNFVRHLGNQDSHFQLSTPNVMDSVVALSVTLQMCYSLLVVYHMKQKK